MSLFMENQTTNTPSPEVLHFGGINQVAVFGTFDGATAQMEVSQDGSPWIPLTETDAIFTANDVVNFTFIKGCSYRLNVTGGGGSLDISASALGVA